MAGRLNAAGTCYTRLRDFDQLITERPDMRSASIRLIDKRDDRGPVEVVASPPGDGIATQTVAPAT